MLSSDRSCRDQLETLTMVRMALDVSAGMQYLAEAGFVV